MLVAATALISLTASSAFAADLAARPYTKAPPMAAAATYSWTGCYVGGNIGGGSARVDQTRIGFINGIIFPADYGSSNGDVNFIGGGQVGCDYQFAGNWVVGIQGMFEFGDLRNSHVLPSFPTFFTQDRVRDVFSVTGRLGYLFAPSVLGYVKGGGAFARVDSAVLGTPGNFLSETARNDRAGYTVGGGVEWMFAPGWSVFGEYNYLDFGRKDVAYTSAVAGSPNPGDLVSTRLTVQQAIVGVNYKFNFGGPVVARY